jgi:hypothetical protein
LKKLKTRCIYEKNERKDTLFLDNHECSGLLTEKICEKCFGDKRVDHDCVKSLLDFKQKLLQTNDELEIKLNSALNQISSLKSENENYLLLIQELSKPNETKPNTANEVKIDILFEIVSFRFRFKKIF